jgi:DNA-binding MarR family transcriptional regulator
MAQIENRTGTLIRDVARLHVRLQRETAACCGGTTMTQCTILTEIGRNGSGTLIELANRLGLDKSWLSRAVENLVQEGLLSKVPRNLDRRTVLISLSGSGEKRFQELNQTLNDQSERVMNHVPPTERENVERALKLLLEALQTELSLSGQTTSCAI